MSEASLVVVFIHYMIDQLFGDIVSLYHKPVLAVTSKRGRSFRSRLLKMEDLPEREKKDLATSKSNKKQSS